MKRQGEREGDRNHVVIRERGETGRWAGEGREQDRGKEPLFTCPAASGSFEGRFPEIRYLFISILLDNINSLKSKRHTILKHRLHANGSLD